EAHEAEVFDPREGRPFLATGLGPDYFPLGTGGRARWGARAWSFPGVWDVPARRVVPARRQDRRGASGTGTAGWAGAAHPLWPDRRPERGHRAALRALPERPRRLADPVVRRRDGDADAGHGPA